MKITIISCSTRDNSQSKKVANYLSFCLTKFNIDNAILDLNDKKLPLYNATENGPWELIWKEISHLLSQSDGFIFISAEWDGMFSAGLHNMLHYTDKELADKPVLLVGVSSGRGGQYPLQQMRIMGYKNKRFVVIPESLYYDHIQQSLIDNAFVNNQIIERTDYALKVLIEYAKSLKLVRDSGVINYEKFSNGL